MAARYFKHLILGHCINLLYLVFMECRWSEVESLNYNDPREGKGKHLNILYRFVFVSLAYSKKTCNAIGSTGSGNVGYSSGGMFKRLSTCWSVRFFNNNGSVFLQTPRI